MKTSAAARPSAATCIEPDGNARKIHERPSVICPDTESRLMQSGMTHAVDILAFVEAEEIPTDYFETPYHLAPAPGGEKVYALLREILRRTRRIGIAYVVIRARQHLAALVPQGQSLVLNTLRWTSETGHTDHFGLPKEDLLAARELAMMAPPGNGDGIADRDLAWHREPYQPEFAALVEHSMKSKKSPEIVVEELDNLLDDDDFISDMLLDDALKRRSHVANGDARRRGARRAHWPVCGAYARGAVRRR